MIIPDHKKALMSIMAKRSHKGEETMAPTPMAAEDHKTEPGMSDDRHAAAQDIIAAMNERSAAKLMESLSNFVDLHGHKAAQPVAPKAE